MPKLLVDLQKLLPFKTVNNSWVFLNVKPSICDINWFYYNDTISICRWAWCQNTAKMAHRNAILLWTILWKGFKIKNKITSISVQFTELFYLTKCSKLRKSDENQIGLTSEVYAASQCKYFAKVVVRLDRKYPSCKIPN